MMVLEVDPGARRARVGPGVTWAELDEATQRHGLAVTGARVSRLEVLEVALGAGSGWLERPLGPSRESVVATESDGDEVHALELALHPVGPTLLGGLLSFPRDRALEVSRAYREYVEAAPPEVGGALVHFAGRGGATTIVFCFAGPLEAGERALAPLRALGPTLDAVGPNRYVDLQAMWDLQAPDGMRVQWSHTPLAGLPDETLERVLDAVERPAASLSHVLLAPGAAHDPTAPWSCQCLAQWPPLDSLDALNRDWAAGVYAAVEPVAAIPASRRSAQVITGP